MDPGRLYVFTCTNHCILMVEDGGYRNLPNGPTIRSVRGANRPMRFPERPSLHFVSFLKVIEDLSLVTDSSLAHATMQTLDPILPADAPPVK